MIDVQNIFHKMEQRTLRAAYKFYCGKTIEGAHEALPDTEATLEVLLAQLEKYQDTVVDVSDDETVGPVPRDMDELGAFVSGSRLPIRQAALSSGMTMPSASILANTKASGWWMY